MENKIRRIIFGFMTAIVIMAFSAAGRAEPSCEVRVKDPGPPMVIEFIFQESQVGLKNIIIKDFSNVTIIRPAVSQGTTDPVTVTVTQKYTFLTFSAVIEATDMEDRTTVCQYPQESEPPQCSVVNVDPGPPLTVLFSIIDPTAGLSSISVAESVNADVNIPSFTVGTTQEVIVEAKKIDPFDEFSVILSVSNINGSIGTCEYSQQAQEDTQSPQLHLTAIDPGPPNHLEITAQDHESGIQTINTIEAVNVDVDIPAFTAGTTEPVLITADQIDENLLFSVEIEVIDQSNNKASYRYEFDTQDPHIFLTAIDYGPPNHLEIAAQDHESGIQSINIIEAVNADISIPDFTVGTTEPVLITADQIEENFQFSVEIEVTDRSGNKKSYRYETLSIETRPEIDLVGQDSEYFFIDDLINQIFINGKDGNGDPINDFSAFQTESFTSSSGQSTLDTCYSIPEGQSYYSILTPTWTQGEYTWEIVLQMKPATDLILRLNGCVLQPGADDVWTDGYQTGFYKLPWAPNQPVFNGGANPVLTLRALPGPLAKEGFSSDGFLMDTRSNSGLQVTPLDESPVTIQSFTGKSIVVVLPVEGRINASGQTMHSLSQGDRIKVTITLPGNTTPDVRFGASGSALQYIGVKGTEYSTDD